LTTYPKGRLGSRTCPASLPFSGRGFRIRPGLSVTTGYVTDAVAQLTRLLDQGVITDGEYDTALSYQRSS
jgi:hypothetical protein